MSIPSPRVQIVIRFVAEKGLVPWFIRYQAGICMPFTPNHVESVSPDGQWYYGEHIVGGLRKRPKGYDAGKLKAEFFVEIPCTQAQADAYYGYLESKLGMPYDWRSIVSFIFPSWNLHGSGELICSAITGAALRKAEVFPITLLWQHRGRWPLGWVCLAVPTLVEAAMFAMRGVQ
jgi:hypothetical protein